MKRISQKTHVMTLLHRGNRGVVWLAWLAVVLLLAGCRQDPGSALTGFDSPVSDDANSASLYKKPGGGGSGGGSPIFPLQASAISKYSNGTYNGTSVNIPLASMFKFDNGALTPPPGTPVGADVEITMVVDLVRYRGDDYLTFTFGPSGCQFSPSATVTLDWSLLEYFNVTLYYIDENNNYIPMAPDEIDITNKKVTLYINHFSRYALSKG